MAASLGQTGPLFRCVLGLFLCLELLISGGLSSEETCASNCTCAGSKTDCSGLKLTHIPADLPEHTETLNLSHNKLTAVDTDILSNLPNLREVRLDHNELTSIPLFGNASAAIVTLYLVCFIFGIMIVDLGWYKFLHFNYGTCLSFCRELSRNRLRLIEGLTFQGLSSLEVLKLQRNNISKLTDGAFWGLARMRTLHLDYNSLKEVNSGSLYGLESLLYLHLSNNSISSFNPEGWGFCERLREHLVHNNLSKLTEGSFAKLVNLQTLRLSHNTISHIAEGAFRGLSSLRLLHQLTLGTISLHWFPEWVVNRGLQAEVQATCAHPESLKGTSIFQVPAQSFVCDDLPKPQITVHPVQTAGVVGKDVRLTCTAASSSSSPMTFTWRKDQEPLRQAEVENFAHVRSSDGGVMEYTTVLHLRDITFDHEGRYQCVISNHFGSTYSNKARLSVSVLPSFVKTPRDITIRAGTKARLECAATGHPTPQVAWQKDGGTDFPAARERRMQVMPDDDVFFIMDVKPEDMGVYSCTAKNTAGMISANVTLTVLETPHLAQGMENRSVVVGETVALQCKALGNPPPRITWLRGEKPLRPSDRHHFTPGNQLLVIGSAALEDAGRYTCVMSNPLGTERAHCSLSVYQRPSGPCTLQSGPSTVTVGIIVIAVVTSIVVTSLVWVCIIYQTRRKSEECSVNTDETIVPPDVPSYLSSQGTLSERQDICIRVESSGGSQPSGYRDSNGFDVPVLCTDCMENSSTYSKPSDYLPHGIAPPSGSEYQQSPPPSTFTSHRTGDTHCNGTPNGVRRDPQPIFPSNHDRSLQKKQSDRRGSSVKKAGTASSPSADESYHHPTKPAPLPPTHTDTECGSELTKTLLPNGHAHTARPAQSESAPLRRASD
uniref:Leucine-rich repeats and immunoglobulin-like domains 1 n=1 Tax=Astyanax mexicanus TaxID=7994 RepID=A0A8B9LIJ8_ASTMX